LQLSPNFVLLFIKNSYIIEICILLGFYVTQNGSSTPMFQDNLSIPIILWLLDPPRWDR